MCFDILIFSTNVLPETFSILRRCERNVIKTYTGLNAKCRLLLADCNETGIFSTDFRRNNIKSNFMKIRTVGTELLLADDRRTDKRDEADIRSSQF
jgi:hypothetical protein